MTHDHDHHHHHDANTYYLEQIFTIGACGALAGVFIMDWYSGKLGYFIKDKYFLLVLTGALLLLGLVIVRAVAVWCSVEEPQLAPVGNHDHDHDHDHGDCGHGHGHDHGHTHEHAHGVVAEAHPPAGSELISGGPPTAARDHAHGHDHDHNHDHAHGHSHGHGHDHSHGWAPWRYVVLLLPVALYFLMPADGLSGAGHQVQADSVSGPNANVKDKGQDFGVTFVQLEQAALSEDLRTYYEGKTVRLLGKYVAQDSDHFTLVRYTMNCCAADAIPLKALTIIDRSKSREPLESNRLNNKWVEVTGQLQFLKLRDGSSFVPAIVIQPTEKTKLTQLVKAVSPPANPFVY
jgi:uncharacterized membrane protein YcgQ (UPF0703/DUF1980 family)